jgi:hypothetical protein
VSRAAPSRGHEPKAPLPSPRPPPRAHRRRSPPWNSAPSPWAAPSQPSPAELSLPLESPASARAKPPSLGPRTGPPAASHRQAHRRPALLPRSVGSPRRLAATPFPPALAGKWAHSDVVTLARSTVSPSLLGRRWAVSASARALAPGVGQKPCPQPRKGEIPFLFSFSTPFSHLNSFLNILCTKNYQKGFPRLHTIMMLENDTL